MIKLAGSVPLYPARISTLCYLLLMVIGGVVLRLPICHEPGARPVSLLDALFTATSAVSVTGLGVVSTANSFSFVGEAVILTLIQVGGVGIMTLTTFFVFQLRDGASLRQQLLVGETLGLRGYSDLRMVLREVLLSTLIWEAVGAICLLPAFLRNHSFLDAVWHATFHSVSAYCNAGFALQDDNLIGFASDPWLNLVVASLITAGGIGFPVQIDLFHWALGRYRRQRPYLQLHTKLTLIGYLTFFMIGFVTTLVIEWDGSLKTLSPFDRVVAAGFHSVSCRTAGFNTVPIEAMAPATLFVSMILMTVGAGSCSCGGGVKVSTVMVMLLFAWSRLRGAERLNIFRRSIPTSLLDRALASTMVFLVIAGASLTALLLVEETAGLSGDRDLFLISAFEVSSALGTVGLTAGLTPQLTPVGKLVVIALMFLGRVGPLAVFSTLAIRRNRRQLEYASEEPLLG